MSGEKEKVKTTLFILSVYLYQKFLQSISVDTKKLEMVVERNFSKYDSTDWFHNFVIAPFLVLYKSLTVVGDCRINDD